jgi:hypothetical protein
MPETAAGLVRIAIPVANPLPTNEAPLYRSNCTVRLSDGPALA